MLAASLKGVTRIYGTGEAAVRALRNVTIDISENCFTVLSGPSGSGKTTVLNIVGCIDRPTEGEIVIAGLKINNFTDRHLADFRAQHLGFIFQSFNLLPVLTAYENIEYPLILLGVGKTQRKARVNEMLDAVGLRIERDRRPGGLSGGQRQRVAIARALVGRPKLVLADEPTANLDSETGQEILTLMRQLQRRYQTSFLFSSHDPQVLSCADEIVSIRDGSIAPLGTTIAIAGMSQ